MSMVVTALAVNPAFLQEIKDSNPDLWAAADRVCQTCRSQDEPVQVCNRLARGLDDLRDALALQFSLEESYGFLSMAAPRCEQISEQISELATRAQAQHSTLYLGISELAEQAEELQYRGVRRDHLADLVERTVQWDWRFRQHEKLEAELIERSFAAV